MLAPASRDSRSPTTAFTVLVTLISGLLVWLVLTSFGLARVQQQATSRLQREIARVLEAEASRHLNADGTLAPLPVALQRLADSTGLLLTLDPQTASGVRVKVSTAANSPSMNAFNPQVILSLLFALLSITLALAAVMLLRLRREHALHRQRSSFTSSVSHEMRTPLAQILLFGETLQLGRARTEADRALATGAIVQEARRLMRLVDNVLRMAKLEREPAKLRQDVVAIDALVRETAQHFAPLAETSHVALCVDAPYAVEALADADALRQVLLNLFDNAVKYGPSSQTIRTRVEHDHNSVRVIVEDEGPGIAEADRERIWLPFERADSRLTSRGGSGLGLTIVRELTEAMSGSVTCESVRSDGGGARFTVTLPTVRAVSRHAEPRRAA